MRAVQTVDHFRLNGIRDSLKDMFHWRRKARVVVKDLAGITYDSATLEKNGLTFDEITLDKLQSGAYDFACVNRKLKAACYLKEGCRGYGVFKDSLIVGDNWFFTAKDNKTGKLHADIGLFNIPWHDACAYSFDTFLAPQSRGNNVARVMLNNSLYAISLLGYHTVYAYYWADNVPAIWNVKVLNKFKEIGDISISRILSLRISHQERACGHWEQEQCRQSARVTAHD
jgi:hypothetical protein